MSQPSLRVVAFVAALVGTGTAGPALAQSPWIIINSPQEWNHNPGESPSAKQVRLNERITIEGQAFHPAGIAAILINGDNADVLVFDTLGLANFEATYMFTSPHNNIEIEVRSHAGDSFSLTYPLAFEDAEDIARYSKDWRDTDSLLLVIGYVDTVAIRMATPPHDRVPARYLTFTSSNPDVLDIDSMGVVTPVTPGSAGINVSGFGKQTHLAVRVYAQPSDVAFSPSDSLLEFVVGQTVSFRAQFWYATGEFVRGLVPKMAGADSIVLSPQAPGDYLALRPGDARLQATSAGRTQQWRIRVAPPRLRIANERAALLLGDSRTLAALRMSLNGVALGPAQGVLWSTTDSATLSVQRDTVTGRRIGRGQLQAAMGPASDTTTLFVLGDLLVGAKDSRSNDVITTVSIARGEAHRIGGDSIEGSSPALSPDGRTIAFVAAREGRSRRIYLMDPDGRNVRRFIPETPTSLGIRISSYEELTPRWLASGDRVVFVSNREGNYDIYSANLDGSGLLRLSSDGNVDWRVTTAPDVGRIAFERRVGSGDGDLVVANADGSGAKIFTTPTGSPTIRVSEGKPELLPGGTHLLYARGAPRLEAADGETLSVFDLTQGGWRDLVPPLKDHELVFAASPDGNRVAYHQRATWGGKNSQITVIDLDGNILATVTLQGIREIMDMTWGATATPPNRM